MLILYTCALGCSTIKKLCFQQESEELINLLFVVWKGMQEISNSVSHLDC